MKSAVLLALAGAAAAGDLPSIIAKVRRHCEIFKREIEY